MITKEDIILSDNGNELENYYFATEQTVEKWIDEKEFPWMTLTKRTYYQHAPYTGTKALYLLEWFDDKNVHYRTYQSRNAAMNQVRKILKNS